VVTAVITTTAAWALIYARMGWSVVPLHDFGSGRCSCRRPLCPSPAKHPRIRWERARQNPGDLEEVRQWWERWPAANVGVVTGRVSGLLVLDVDPRNGGMASLARLTSSNGPLPDSPLTKTGGGGRHVWMRSPSFSLFNCQLGAGIEIKAEGGMVVAPPSLHASGERYRWSEDRGPLDIDLPDAPEWLLELIQSEAGDASRSAPVPVRTASERSAFAAAWRRLGVQLGEGDRHYLCPFHPDHRPSLHIDADGCRWYCFGCHRGGGLGRLLDLLGDPPSPRLRRQLRSTFGRPRPVTLPGTHVVKVVGESVHQNELLSLTGGRRSYGGVEIQAVAELVPVRSFDRLPIIEVDIEGVPVGVLDNVNAVRYTPRIESSLDEEGGATCRAIIRGGWDRGKGDVAPFGVVLELPEVPTADSIPRLAARRGFELSTIRVTC